MINEHLDEIGEGLDSYPVNYDNIFSDFNSEITKSSMYEFCILQT